MTQATMWPRKRRSSPLGLVAGAETGSALWCASWLAQRTPSASPKTRHQSFVEMSCLRCPLREPRHLAVQIGTLVVRGDTGIEAEPAGLAFERRLGGDQDHPPHLHRRHRQRPLPEPPVGGLWVHPLEPGPLGQFHYHHLTAPNVCMLTESYSGGNSSQPSAKWACCLVPEQTWSGCPLRSRRSRPATSVPR